VFEEKADEIVPLAVCGLAPGLCVHVADALAIPLPGMAGAAQSGLHRGPGLRRNQMIALIFAIVIALALFCLFRSMAGPAIVLVIFFIVCNRIGIDPRPILDTFNHVVWGTVSWALFG
jgi:hypothetical protein